MLNKSIKFFLQNQLFAYLLFAVLVIWGARVIPFPSSNSWVGADSVAIDAIPDLGENQQIVFTKWDGRSPKDIEDQITYPLTSSLLGIPGVKTIRSSSMLGFSSIYIIFEEAWAGHLGIKLVEKIIPIINGSQSTLIFTNTRAQCEIWYQKLLDAAPELAGAIAMHHGSISRELRDWVEDALHEARLKAVVIHMSRNRRRWSHRGCS